MDILSFILNITIRVRHRRMYAGGCVLLLLLVTVILLFVMGPDHYPLWSLGLSSNDYTVSLVDRQQDDNTPDCELIEITETPSPLLQVEPTEKLEEYSLSTIFAITPTRKRLTQLLDLTSLCQTLMNIKNLIWIVVESTYVKTDLVADLLNRCTVKSVHLSSNVAVRRGDSSKLHMLQSTNRAQGSSKRKVAERNIGLEWIRNYCRTDIDNCTGAIYFMDDENKYDLRLFQQIRQVDYVGLWPVAYSGRLKFEGPVCVNGSIVEWHVLSTISFVRPFPINVAGFAVNIQTMLQFPDAKFGYAPHSMVRSKVGWDESDFLQNFLNDRSDHRIECKGSDKEAYVWHVQSEIDPYLRKHSYKWKYKLRT